MDERDFAEAAGRMAEMADEEVARAALESSPDRRQVLEARAASFRSLEQRLKPSRPELLLTIRIG